VILISIVHLAFLKNAWLTQNSDMPRRPCGRQPPATAAMPSQETARIDRAWRSTLK